MVRLLLALVGLIQFAAPDWVVYVYTRLAYEDPAAFRVRPWVPIALRLEGLVMVWLAVRDVAPPAEPERPDRADERRELPRQ